MDAIVIKGARQHNLKNIDVVLPKNSFIVITGLSGSGKSSLAFDTIYAEGQRRYVESLSSYARQFLGIMQKPDVESIEGLSPAISIDQKTSGKNPRSTVGTITEIYDYLRVLYARIGIPHCPTHHLPIQAQSPQKIVERISTDVSGTVIVLAPLVVQRKGTYERLIEDIHQKGFSRVRVDGTIFKTTEKIPLERYKKHTIEVVVDRLNVNDASRLTEAVEKALALSGGMVSVLPEKGDIQVYSSRFACPVCGETIEELHPRIFSFNSPFGACETCHGLGVLFHFDPDLIIPDKSKSLAEGAIALYRNVVDAWRLGPLLSTAEEFGIDIHTPIEKLSPEHYRLLLFGSPSSGRSTPTLWEGLIPQAERLYKSTTSEYRKQELEKFMRTQTCPSCKGKRLKQKVLGVLIEGKSIIDVTDLPIEQALSFFRSLSLNEKERSIASSVLTEIMHRLQFLVDVGVGYLSLSRPADTLSGGESQRIRLATQVGTRLTGVIYVLDEPSIGLHQRDNEKLLRTLRNLRDLGNTLIVVEHDEDTIRSADHVVDLGPGAGEEGGRVVAQGPPDVIAAHPESITGAYLSGRRSIPLPSRRRSPRGFLTVHDASEHNLKHITVSFPLGTFIAVTGVSGSGKSTLIHDVLYYGLLRKLSGVPHNAGKHQDITWEGRIDGVILIDQSPIGRTPRSNPATYTGVFDEIREVFAHTREAQERGYTAGRFSFNVRGGRCEACQGEGVLKIEMHFLPDVYVTCDECKGTRYNRETLAVYYKGKTIADVLSMSVDEAYTFFEHYPSIQRKLALLKGVGLGYIRLGQSSPTLSGGEAQRIKLARELSKRGAGNTIYLLDEPTTGLHMHDVHKLISVLHTLVDRGNTVIVIEHNLDVVKCADHVIDLGPEGGDAGGSIVAQGTPEEIARNPHSYTGQWLAKKYHLA